MKRHGMERGKIKEQEIQSTVCSSESLVFVARVRPAYERDSNDSPNQNK